VLCLTLNDASLGATPGAQLAWGVGYLLVVFDLSANIDYEGEKAKKSAKSRSVNDIRKLKLAKAREQFKV